jgi:HEAT repeat protein
VQDPQRNAMALAMTQAILSAARLGHHAALTEAERILQIEAQECPPTVRAAAAFALGVLGEDGKAPDGVNLLAIYESPDEARATKVEALKALGHLRHAASAQRLKAIISSDPNPDLRWIAHWAYERCSGTHIPYTPPTARREPAVSITDLTR